MGDNYNVELSKRRPPKIKIIDFNKELNEDKICSDLIEQNHLHVSETWLMPEIMSDQATDMQLILYIRMVNSV
nr:unnamed protein product [Callosobruchus analis]